SNNYDCGLHVVRNVELTMTWWPQAQAELFGSQTAPLFSGDIQSMSEYRQTIWGWIVESADDFSSSTLDPEAFHRLLAWERHDLASKYLERVGVEGTSLIEAQGVPEEYKVEENQAKKIIAGILDSASTEKVVNALNMPSSASHPDMDIYCAVSCDNRAHASVGVGKAHGLPLGNQAHGLRKWTIASTCGTCHLPHVDANGLCTLVTIIEGFKLWIWGWALFADCIVLAVVLGPGDTIILPPCTPHAVFSVSKEGFWTSSILMAGSHFLSRYTLGRTIEGAIFHALYHDMWTNADHDDMVFNVELMIHDLLMHHGARPAEKMFANDYVFALVAFARFAPWLRTLPHKPHKDDPIWLIGFDPIVDLSSRLNADESTKAATSRMLTALNMVASKADTLALEFTTNQMENFQEFWQATYNKLVTEILWRTQYNIDNQDVDD
ncbi:hypothetical protein DL93DRAFT_2173907, partial [Clavulina sp. PMI_390]